MKYILYYLTNKEFVFKKFPSLYGPQQQQYNNKITK